MTVKRKKPLKLAVEHKVFGQGVLVERKTTDLNKPMVVVRFPDQTRSLLASPEYWLALPDLAAIPMVKPKAEPVEDEPEIEIEETHDEDEDELAA
jgi:hypothetical protein